MPLLRRVVELEPNKPYSFTLTEEFHRNFAGNQFMVNIVVMDTAGQIYLKNNMAMRSIPETKSFKAVFDVLKPSKMLETYETAFNVYRIVIRNYLTNLTRYRKGKLVLIIVLLYVLFGMYMTITEDPEFSKYF